MSFGSKLYDKCSDGRNNVNEWAGELGADCDNRINRQEKDDYPNIKEVLKECGGNRTLAAKRLGIARSTLWRLLKD